MEFFKDTPTKDLLKVDETRLMIQKELMAR